MNTSGPLKVVNEGNVTVVIFGSGQRRLDELGLDGIGQQLLEIAQHADPPRLLLDMAGTEFFGSSFIEVLFRVWNRLNARPDAKFAISGLQEYCREVLEITHLDRLWPLYDSRGEALAALAV